MDFGGWRCLAGQAAAGWQGAPAAQRAHMRRFCLGYRAIHSACGLLVTDGGALARAYMRHVLAQQGMPWWQAHASDAAQPWFIWQYACENGLVSPCEPGEGRLNVKLILPAENAQAKIVLLQVERNAAQPEQGLVHLHCAADDLTQAQARALRCRYIPGGYVRRVDECGAPILDRAVELGIALLGQGIGVCVQEEGLHDRLLQEDFVPEHLHWVRAAQAPEWLWLTYPYDAALHGYLLKMGGRWTGKQLLLPVTASDRLQDIVRLYDFRLTRGAQQRLALWEEARSSATVFSPRRARNAPPQPGTMDRFRQMLEAQADIPADLRDPADE